MNYNRILHDLKLFRIRGKKWKERKYKYFIERKKEKKKKKRRKIDQQRRKGFGGYWRGRERKKGWVFTTTTRIRPSFQTINVTVWQMVGKCFVAKWITRVKCTLKISFFLIRNWREVNFTFLFSLFSILFFLFRSSFAAYIEWDLYNTGPQGRDTVRLRSRYLYG